VASEVDEFLAIVLAHRNADRDLHSEHRGWPVSAHPGAREGRRAEEVHGELHTGIAETGAGRAGVGSRERRFPVAGRDRCEDTDLAAQAEHVDRPHEARRHRPHVGPDVLQRQGGVEQHVPARVTGRDDDEVRANGCVLERAGLQFLRRERGAQERRHHSPSPGRHDPHHFRNPHGWSLAH
jgi:hypothetical protein